MSSLFVVRHYYIENDVIYFKITKKVPPNFFYEIFYIKLSEPDFEGYWCRAGGSNLSHKITDEQRKELTPFLKNMKMKLLLKGQGPSIEAKNLYIEYEAKRIERFFEKEHTNWFRYWIDKWKNKKK